MYAMHGPAGLCQTIRVSHYLNIPLYEVLFVVRPSVVPLLTTNRFARADRKDGILFVTSPGRAVKITAIVKSDPCPTVQWSLDGSTLVIGSNYTLRSLCDNSPYTFTLVITDLRLQYSGRYTAVFDNGYGGITSIPGIVITVPGKDIIIV